ncbi:MAG: hypothetical protein IJV02_04585, partial [Candidatus Methanomethylophilaceae archaeon]|nr:hypothetical protein [Candidatus Methanomethylophilaceae archaeon]
MTELTATAILEDAPPSSGMYQIEYVLASYDNGVKGPETPGTAAIIDGRADFQIPADFKGQIFVKGFDYVGNESTEVTPQSFAIDTPERHSREEHITIDGLREAAYSDAAGQPLYDNSVDVTVTITDTMSGIREITYGMTSEKNTQENQTIVIGNTGNTVGQDLGDGWIVSAMDENLVTVVVRNYHFGEDDNDIQLHFEMKDRSNNPDSKSSNRFSIDMTAPTISVAFQNTAGNKDTYRESRQAVVTVTERNFDASKITADIKNAIGSVPALHFTSKSNTEHEATLTFGQGDYTFSLSGMDMSGHAADVKYSGGNESKFSVDLSDPVERDNFDQFINDLDNSFNFDKEMSFTIEEHNFVPELVKLHVYRVPAGTEMTNSSREDCTDQYYTPEKWNTQGDTHTFSFKISEDYVYQVTISVQDASGRSTAEKASPVFEIDKTAPVLKTPVNKDTIVYTRKDTATSAEAIVFQDSNIDHVDYVITSYQLKRNDENVGYAMDIQDETVTIDNDSIVINDKYFDQDGIYEVKSSAFDVAGNESKEAVHTYIIQRDSEFLVYIPNSDKKAGKGLYAFDQK